MSNEISLSSKRLLFAGLVAHEPMALATGCVPATVCPTPTESRAPGASIYCSGKTPSCHAMLLCLLFIAIGVVLLGGCQRKAYTDLYVERMAGEIRELEDRIFEYDAAYRQTEDELDIIRSENETLRSKLAQQSSSPQRSSNSPLRQRLEELRDSRSESSSGSDSSRSSSSPKATPTTPILPQLDPIADSISGPFPDPAPNAIPKGLTAPPTNKSSPAKPTAPSRPEILDLEPPEIELGVPGSIETLPFKLPQNSPLPNATIPGSLLPPPLPNFPTTQNKDTNNGIVRVAANQETETPMIPLPSALDPEAVASHQIVVPAFVKKNSNRDSTAVVQAGATHPSTTHSRSRGEVIGKPDWITQPKDTRVVEIAFHASLCRGTNRESDPNEDGLRLVLQPKNQDGDFLPAVAGMTIVVVDPGRPEAESKIGRWTWTADELQQSLEPIGVSQGFHVAVAWQSKRPIAKSVQVHVRYEMADGRRLVNEKTIELHTPSLGSDAWTPRVSR